MKIKEPGFPRLGVIGGGRWGQNIISALVEMGHLCAIAENNLHISQQLQLKYPKLQHFNLHQELLASDVDGVLIATPAFTHFAIAKEALLAKKNVFVEKPMARTTQEADELIALAKQNECILMVGHLLLYQPAIQIIKNFLQAGNLGKVYSLRQTRCNLGTIRSQEDVVYSLGVHDLAVLDYLIAEPVKEMQVVGQKIVSPKISDDVIIHMRYESNIHAHLQLNWLWPYKERHLMVLGEKGALFFDELQQNVTFFCHTVEKDFSISNKGSEIIYQGKSSPLKLELQHFVECIQNNKTPLSCGIQGRAVIALLDQISTFLGTA